MKKLDRGDNRAKEKKEGRRIKATGKSPKGNRRRKISKRKDIKTCRFVKYVVQQEEVLSFFFCPAYIGTLQQLKSKFS